MTLTIRCQIFIILQFNFWKWIEYKIDSMWPLFLNYPMAIIWAITIIFWWFFGLISSPKLTIFGWIEKWGTVRLEQICWSEALKFWVPCTLTLTLTYFIWEFGDIYVTDGMFSKKGTTSVPKSVLRYLVNKVRLFFFVG